MKNITEFFRTNNSFQLSNIEILNENEMQIVRGGTEPLKPISRPREIFDPEED